MQIGAQLLGRADAGPEVADPGRPRSGRTVPRPKPDGTLLAVVPIPGTGTSMAIVGYPVTAPGAIGARPRAAGADEAERIRQRIRACCSTTTSAGSGWTGPRSR